MSSSFLLPSYYVCTYIRVRRWHDMDGYRLRFPFGRRSTIALRNGDLWCRGYLPTLCSIAYRCQIDRRPGLSGSRVFTVTFILRPSLFLSERGPPRDHENGTACYRACEAGRMGTRPFLPASLTGPCPARSVRVPCIHEHLLGCVCRYVLTLDTAEPCRPASLFRMAWHLPRAVSASYGPTTLGERDMDNLKSPIPHGRSRLSTAKTGLKRGLGKADPRKMSGPSWIRYVFYAGCSIRTDRHLYTTPSRLSQPETIHLPLQRSPGSTDMFHVTMLHTIRHLRPAPSLRRLGMHSPLTVQGPPRAGRACRFPRAPTPSWS